MFIILLLRIVVRKIDVVLSQDCGVSLWVCGRWWVANGGRKKNFSHNVRYKGRKF